MIRISITAKITGLVLGCVILSIATDKRTNDFNNLFFMLSNQTCFHE